MLLTPSSEILKRALYRNATWRSRAVRVRVEPRRDCNGPAASSPAIQIGAVSENSRIRHEVKEGSLGHSCNSNIPDYGARVPCTSAAARTPACGSSSPARFPAETARAPVLPGAEGQMTRFPGELFSSSRTIDFRTTIRHPSSRSCLSTWKTVEDKIRRLPVRARDAHRRMTIPE